MFGVQNKVSVVDATSKEVGFKDKSKQSTHLTEYRASNLKEARGKPLPGDEVEIEEHEHIDEALED